MSELYGALFFLALSFIYLIFGLNVGIFMLKATKTKGVIVDIEIIRGGEGTLTKTTVEYKALNGRIYQYEVPFRPAFKNIGDRVNIYYDIKKPNENIVVTPYTVINNLTMGLILLGISTYYLIKYWQA